MRHPTKIPTAIPYENISKANTNLGSEEKGGDSFYDSLQGGGQSIEVLSLHNLSKKFSVGKGQPS